MEKTKRPKTTALAHRKLLLVEDNTVDRMLLRRILERAGITDIHEAADGLEGLNACLRDPPDALLLDLDLPTLRGEEVLRMLRSSPRFQKIPVIIVSDLSEARRREMELLRIGADVYLKKPFHPELLLAALGRLLRGGEKDISSKADPEESSSSSSQGSGDFIRETMDDALHEQEHPASPDEEDTLAHIPPPESPPRQATPDRENFHGYVLQELIGSGGMGTIYRAIHKDLQRTVALKILVKGKFELAQAIERFRREAQIMARFDHPNIVRVYDAEVTELTYYIVMEFAENGSLHDAIKVLPIQRDEFFRIVPQVCEGLIELHRNNVLHRDIKPGNILVTASNLYKIGDFGLSRMQETAPGDSRFTVVRHIMGTHSFMAPEVAAGEDATELSDQYSLSKTLFRLLLPRRESPEAEALRKGRPDFNPALGEVLMRALSANAQDRYAGIPEFRDAIMATQ